MSEPKLSLPRKNYYLAKYQKPTFLHDLQGMLFTSGVNDPKKIQRSAIFLLKQFTKAIDQEVQYVSNDDNEIVLALNESNISKEDENVNVTVSGNIDLFGDIQVQAESAINQSNTVPKQSDAKPNIPDAPRIQFECLDLQQKGLLFVTWPRNAGEQLRETYSKFKQIKQNGQNMEVIAGFWPAHHTCKAELEPILHYVNKTVLEWAGGSGKESYKFYALIKIRCSGNEKLFAEQISQGLQKQFESKVTFDNRVTDCDFTLLINIVKMNAMIGWIDFEEDPKLIRWRERKAQGSKQQTQQEENVQ